MKTENIELPYTGILPHEVIYNYSTIMQHLSEKHIKEISPKIDIYYQSSRIRNTYNQKPSMNRTKFK